MRPAGPNSRERPGGLAEAGFEEFGIGVNLDEAPGPGQVAGDLDGEVEAFGSHEHVCAGQIGAPPIEEVRPFFAHLDRGAGGRPRIDEKFQRAPAGDFGADFIEGRSSELSGIGAFYGREQGGGRRFRRILLASWHPILSRCFHADAHPRERFTASRHFAANSLRREAGMEGL